MRNVATETVRSREGVPEHSDERELSSARAAAHAPLVCPVSDGGSGEVWETAQPVRGTLEASVQRHIVPVLEHRYGQHLAGRTARTAARGFLAGEDRNGAASA